MFAAVAFFPERSATGPQPSANALLLEGGAAILTESGQELLIETVFGLLPNDLINLETGDFIETEAGGDLLLEKGISLQSTYNAVPDPDEIDYTLSESVTGTLYWVLTATADKPTLSTAGFDTAGLANGSFAVNAGSGSNTIDLSSVSPGSYFLHSVIKRTSDSYYTGRTTEPVTIAGNPLDYLLGAGDNEGWWPTDSGATMYQELPGGGTTVAGNGDVVGTVLNEDTGGEDLGADSASARPDRNNTEGLLDWNTTAKRAMKVVTTTRGSDMYFACIMQTTQSPTVYVLEGNATVLYVLAVSGNGTSPFSNIGTPAIYVDGVELVSPTRGTLYTAIADGSKHLVEVIGADMTQSNWSTTYFGGKSANYLGLSGDYFLSENTQAARDNIPGILAARHGITLP